MKQFVRVFWTGKRFGEYFSRKIGSNRLSSSLPSFRGREAIETQVLRAFVIYRGVAVSLVVL